MNENKTKQSEIFVYCLKIFMAFYYEYYRYYYFLIGRTKGKKRKKWKARKTMNVINGMTCHNTTLLSFSLKQYQLMLS